MGNEHSKPSRLFYLDNFRTYLTALVIIHHTSISYGGAGAWDYVSRFHISDSSPALIAFCAIDQTYFMGSFFLLSGAMSASSLVRKGRTQFLKGRWLKLGAPILVYALVAPPIQRAILRSSKGKKLRRKELLAYWKGLRAVQGPLWYTAVLLVFDSVYSFMPRQKLASLTRLSPLLVFVVDITSSFLVRLRYSVGETFVPLNVQPAYLPQYVACYLLGAVRGPVSSIVLSRSMRISLGLASIFSGLAIPALLYAYPNVYTIQSIKGGRTLPALSYAIWNETTGYLLGSSILKLFRTSHWLNRSWGSLGRYSYAAFLVHSMIVVGVQAVSDRWKASGILKTILIGTTGVLGSWGVGWVLLRFPGVRNVLA